MMIVVAAALIDAEGRVLVQRRPAGKAMAGLWEFPGGKVETGEAPAAALARELREELAIGVSEEALAPLAFAAEGDLLLLLYVASAWSGDPTLLHAEEIAWVAPAKLEPASMPPADRPLVAALRRLGPRRR